MAKYRTPAGVIVDYEPSYVAVFPDGAFVPVEDESAKVTKMGCCGADEWDLDDDDTEDSPDTEKEEG